MTVCPLRIVVSIEHVSQEVLGAWRVGHHFHRNQLQPPPDPHRSPCVSADGGPPSGVQAVQRTLPGCPFWGSPTRDSGCQIPGPCPKRSLGVPCLAPALCPLLTRVGPRLILSKGFGRETLWAQPWW